MGSIFTYIHPLSADVVGTENMRERERGFHLYDRQNVESEALQGKRDLHTREKMKISDEWII